MKPERVGSPALILGCQGGWSRPRRPGMGNGGPGGWPLSPGLEALEESREAGGAVDRPQEAPESPGATAPPGPPVNPTQELLHWPKGELAHGAKTHLCNHKTCHEQGDQSWHLEVRSREMGEVRPGAGAGAGGSRRLGTWAAERATGPLGPRPPSRCSPAPRGCVLAGRRPGLAGHLTLWDQGQECELRVRDTPTEGLPCARQAPCY